MLNRNRKERISAISALKHKWFVKYEDMSPSKKERGDSLVISMRNIQNFVAGTTLQKAVMSYIASQQIDPDTEKRMRKVFEDLDDDKNGQLNEKELTDGYEKIYGDRAKAQRIAQMVMRKSDMNHNGSIDYNEFLTACMDDQKALAEESLKTAFNFYDQVFFFSHFIKLGWQWYYYAR